MQGQTKPSRRSKTALPALQVPRWPFKSALKLPRTHFICILEWKWSSETRAHKHRRGHGSDSGGIRFQFKFAAANVTTLTPQNGTAGKRPRGLDGGGEVWSGWAAVSGPMLSKWNKSCQLSRSVQCPPQAGAYQAHLSLSCLCLLISICIFLSLPPKGGILGPLLNANYSLVKRNRTLRSTGCEHWRTRLLSSSLKFYCSESSPDHDFCHCIKSQVAEGRESRWSRLEPTSLLPDLGKGGVEVPF